jgi:hypothetical protein
MKIKSTTILFMILGRFCRNVILPPVEIPRIHRKIRWLFFSSPGGIRAMKKRCQIVPKLTGRAKERAQVKQEGLADTEKTHLSG